jgi:hypothetical protein
VAIVDPGDDGLERAEDSASANALDFEKLNLTNLRASQRKTPVAGRAVTRGVVHADRRGRVDAGPDVRRQGLALLRIRAFDINATAASTRST